MSEVVSDLNCRCDSRLTVGQRRAAE